jgi:hypothetical protein
MSRNPQTIYSESPYDRSDRLTPQNLGTQRFGTPPLQLGLESSQRRDPLSEVLALRKPQLYIAGGFAVLGDAAIRFPKHPGIKCYAMLAGRVLTRRRRCIRATARSRSS